MHQLKKILSIVMLICLSGCQTYEYYGHYKFDESKVKQGATKEEIIETFGAPLKLTNNDNVFYYMYSRVKKHSLGSIKEEETKIMRLEFKKDVLIKYETFKYQDYVSNPERTPQPDMHLPTLTEIISGIGEISDLETMREKAHNNNHHDSRNIIKNKNQKT